MCSTLTSWELVVKSDVLFFKEFVTMDLETEYGAFYERKKASLVDLFRNMATAQDGVAAVMEIEEKINKLKQQALERKDYLTVVMAEAAALGVMTCVTDLLKE